MKTLTPLSIVISQAYGLKCNVHNSDVTRFVKKHDITVVGTAKFGKGFAHLVTIETANKVRNIISQELEAAASLATPERRTVTEESPAEIHIGALEAKCDRIEQSLNELQTLVGELIKANNLLADKQAKVLTSLGAA